MGILSRRLKTVESETHVLLQSKKSDHSRMLIKRNQTIINNLKTWIKDLEAKEKSLPKYFGLFEGEVCAREGCDGSIELNDKMDSCCTCFQVAPCGYCMTPNSYCSSCDYVSYQKH